MATEIPLAPRDVEAVPTLYVADENGNWFLNRNARVLLIVENAHSADTLVVTIEEQRTCGHSHHYEEQGFIHRTLNVPSGSTAFFGPFERWAFNEAGTNRVYVTYSFTEEAATPVVGVAALVDSESRGY